MSATGMQGLSRVPMEQDIILSQLLVGDGHNPLLEGVVGLNLGLNDGDEAVLLADTGVAGQAVHSLIDGPAGGGVVHHVDAGRLWT